MTTEARIERLRKFCKGELAYADLCGDIACLLEELTVAKLAIGLSSAHEKALIDDAEKHRAENARLRAVGEAIQFHINRAELPSSEISTDDQAEMVGKIATRLEATLLDVADVKDKIGELVSAAGDFRNVSTWDALTSTPALYANAYNRLNAAIDAANSINR